MLMPFFEWLQALSLSQTISNSNWAYALIQALHLVALAFFAGAILVVDFRLLGRGFSQQPLARVARDAQPWLVSGFLAMVLTGIPQLMSGAMKEYHSPLFWWKMWIMVVAIIFTFVIRRKVVMIDEARLRPFWGKIVGLTSMALWAAVAIHARLIGLF